MPPEVPRMVYGSCGMTPGPVFPLGLSTVFSIGAANAGLSACSTALSRSWTAVTARHTGSPGGRGLAVAAFVMARSRTGWQPGS